MRATVSEIGPVLFSRILNLNPTQSAVLALVFKIAYDAGLLLNLKDLQAMLQFVGTDSNNFRRNTATSPPRASVLSGAASSLSTSKGRPLSRRGRL